MESKAGVGGGTMVDLLHEGTVLRESEIPIDHPDATVRTEQRIRESVPKLFAIDKHIQC